MYRLCVPLIRSPCQLPPHRWLPSAPCRAGYSPLLVAQERVLDLHKLPAQRQLEALQAILGQFEQQQQELLTHIHPDKRHGPGDIGAWPNNPKLLRQYMQTLPRALDIYSQQAQQSSISPPRWQRWLSWRGSAPAQSPAQMQAQPAAA